MAGRLFDPSQYAGGVGVGEMDKSKWEVFKTWMSEHDKKYSSEVEMNYRFGLFSDRLKWIEEENKKNNSYKMGLTQFTDSASEEVPFGNYDSGSPFELEDEELEKKNMVKKSFNYVKEHGMPAKERREGGREKLIFISGYTSVAPDEMSLLRAVRKHPVCVMLAGHPTMLHYKEGIYNGPFGNKLNCWMMAVGFDHHCVILQNCWGTKWGEEGYMRVVRKLPGHPYGPGGLYSRVVYPNMDGPESSQIHPNESDSAEVGEMAKAECSTSGN